MKKLISLGMLLGVAIQMATTQVLAVELLMTAPPRESKAVGNRLYAPLAQHIAKITGASVRYQHPGNWFNYQRNMRKGKYDIIFDGPHFVSWRKVHLQHDVLVKLPGQLEFYLLANKDDHAINTLDDLMRKKICAMPLPDLSSLSVLDRYRNPVRQPVIVGVKGGMAKVYQAFKRGKCRAVVLRTTFYREKMTQEQRNTMKILFHSKPRPNQAISVSRKLDANAKHKIIQSLTVGDGVQASKAILERFGGEGVKSFVRVKDTEYDRHNELLEGIIFGW